MFIVTPEVARAVHDDRQRRLLTAAEAQRVRRVRREVAAARRAERPAWRPSGRLRSLLRGRRRHDEKIARLAASWLELDGRTARRLAQAGDEVAMLAGETLTAGRFSYIGLDEAHRGLVVTTGTPPVTIEEAASVLVLTTDDLDAIVPGAPRLAAARSSSLAASDAATRVARELDGPRETVAPDPLGRTADIDVTGPPRRNRVRRPATLTVANGIVGVDRTIAGSASRG